jgi:hypothetical protein
VYLLSVEGKNGMLTGRACLCPVCYTHLNNASFESVGPKIEFNLPASYNSYADRFAEQPLPGNVPYNRNNSEVKNVGVSARSSVGASANSGIRNANGNTGTLVILKGVVGAGKSTFSQKILEGVLARGGHCIVEGTDKYCKTGMQTREAVFRVQRSLEEISRIANDDLVVVIDTCGEQTQEKQMKVFNVNFDGWKKVTLWPNLTRDGRGNAVNLVGYFAWSLRNVLLRKRPTARDSHYLNAESAGTQVCIDVHKKKSKALFNKRVEFEQWKFDNASISSLEALAEDYAKSLPEFQLMV